MTSTPALADAERHLRQVKDHIDELRRMGRDEDALAVSFVRDLARQALAGQRTEKARRDLLTTGQAGLALGISDQTVRNWVTSGRLPAVKRGVRTMIPRDAVVLEIDRSRVLPSGSGPVVDQEPSGLSWRRELVDALPSGVIERLDELHEDQEDGRELTSEESAELIRLERMMADAAARQLVRFISRKQAART